MPAPTEECGHPVTRRHIEERELHGQVVRVEVCDACGRELVNPADAQKLLETRGSEEARRLSPRDVVLALLGVFPSRPIINRIVLMKEAFLLEHEAAREAGLSIQGLQFVPYDYGPYSRLIDQALQALESDGLVHIQREAQGQKEVIALSDHGADAAQELLTTLGSRKTEALQRRRKGWDQLGYYGLLRKVYEEYPAFRSRSKIADKIRPQRRWT